MDFVRDWIEKSGYTAALGVALDELSEEKARLVLPFREANTNPGKALHGGCAASLGVISGQVLARANLGPDSGPWHTCGLQVNYTAAAIDEGVEARATLLRRGKEMCFVEVEVSTDGGKRIAHVTTAARGRFGKLPAALVTTRGDDGASDPGAMGPHVGKMPYTAARGIDVQHMADAHSRIVMPAIESNGDAGGGVHEGAVLALLDTTGAMAAWAETGPGRYKASTPSLQAQFLAPPPTEDLVGYGHLVQRDDEIFFSDVEVAGCDSGSVYARGTVIYRIVV